MVTHKHTNLCMCVCVYFYMLINRWIRYPTRRMLTLIHLQHSLQRLLTSAGRIRNIGAKCGRLTATLLQTSISPLATITTVYSTALLFYRLWRRHIFVFHIFGASSCPHTRAWILVRCDAFFAHARHLLRHAAFLLSVLLLFDIFMRLPRVFALLCCHFSSIFYLHARQKSPAPLFAYIAFAISTLQACVWLCGKFYRKKMW